ncbi:MAG: AIR synthase-related protein [Thermoplasmatales archaeon]
MGFGKVDLERLSKIITNHRSAMLESNVIGSDFSFGNFGGRTLIFKIEPMVYYPFLTSIENAMLSLIFPMNDFLTSGREPKIAMIDIEKPADAGDDYWNYVDFLLLELEHRNIKVASGHTGNYENTISGVAGSLALVGFQRPIFSYKRMTKEDAFYVVGRIGAEMEFFLERMKPGKRAFDLEDLSIEKYVRLFSSYKKDIHYVHDLSEGGLIRGLEEISILNRRGFDVNYSATRPLIVDERPGRRAIKLSSSSSGSIVVSVDREYKKEFEDIATANSWQFAEIRCKGRDVTVNGRRVSSHDEFSRLIG